MTRFAVMPARQLQRLVRHGPQQLEPGENLTPDDVAAEPTVPSTFKRDRVPLQRNDSNPATIKVPNDQVKLRGGRFDVMTRLAVMPPRQLQRLVRPGPTLCG